MPKSKKEERWVIVNKKRKTIARNFPSREEALEFAFQQWIPFTDKRIEHIRKELKKRHHPDKANVWFKFKHLDDPTSHFIIEKVKKDTTIKFSFEDKETSDSD